MQRRRIVIYGVTGSGKTTLGRRLAQELGLQHIELDALYHGPGWTPTPAPEFLEKVRRATDEAAGGWVADGNYGSVREFLLLQADTVVWLRLPWRTSYLRMVRRTLSRVFTRKELWNGNKETLRNLLLEKDSLLLWGIRQHKPSQARIAASLHEAAHGAEVFEVRSPAELDALARRFADERAAAATASA